MRYCFFFNDTAPTEIYTLSLHDALPILRRLPRAFGIGSTVQSTRALFTQRVIRPLNTTSVRKSPTRERGGQDRKSTRLNSSHSSISYAVFCLKKKKKDTPQKRH